MGFWAEYYSTLLKGVTATTWKEKIEARKLVKGLNKEDHQLFVTIRREVEEHKVTRALGDMEKFVPRIAHTADVAERLIFNAITQDRQIIKAENDILQALRELSEKVRNNPNNQVLRKVERELAISVYQGCKEADSEDREEYKIVLEILNESGKHHKFWMRKIRLAFQNEQNQNILARWVIRSEIVDETRNIKKLQRVAIDIRDLTKKVEAQKDSKHQTDLLEKSLIRDYEEVRVAVQKAFKDSYLIKKRVLLMFLKILFDLHTLRQLIENWVSVHNLPEQSGKRLIEEVMGIEDKIAKHFKPLAQGFRIIIAAIDNIQNLALKVAHEV